MCSVPRRRVIYQLSQFSRSAVDTLRSLCLSYSYSRARRRGFNVFFFLFFIILVTSFTLYVFLQCKAIFVYLTSAVSEYR